MSDNTTAFYPVNTCTPW